MICNECRRPIGFIAFYKSYSYEFKCEHCSTTSKIPHREALLGNIVMGLLLGFSCYSLGMSLELALLLGMTLGGLLLRLWYYIK